MVPVILDEWMGPASYEVLLTSTSLIACLYLNPGGAFVQYDAMQLTLPAKIEVSWPCRLVSTVHGAAADHRILPFWRSHVRLVVAGDVVGLYQVEFLNELGKGRIAIDYDLKVYALERIVRYWCQLRRRTQSPSCCFGYW